MLVGMPKFHIRRLVARVAFFSNIAHHCMNLIPYLLHWWVMLRPCTHHIIGPMHLHLQQTRTLILLTLTEPSRYFSTPFHNYIPSIDAPNNAHHNWNLGITCSSNMKHASQWLKAADVAFLENTDILKPSCLLLAYIYGIATVQNWKNDWEELLSKQTNWNCYDHYFSLLDLFSQLITVTLLSRRTVLIIISIQPVSVTESHPKNIVAFLRIWW